jgi:hypothetical protein
MLIIALCTALLVGTAYATWAAERLRQALPRCNADLVLF